VKRLKVGDDREKGPRESKTGLKQERKGREDKIGGGHGKERQKMIISNKIKEKKRNTFKRKEK